ncbi:NAD(P)/FAD-dependent oxidoreductase [Granulosicoccus antarcticus]|uniref:Gamma-glutamylputrescine oxidoreductase n=1 Tax=Granulosicoccus antarcticus IMCC3135 TaxID=1192854 RepID=A0A2Z2NH46_9GAMM|nr:FAD-binding oxidoreductase [Granulosicoccus antarcticus]ASJ70616.1 Gamma-glutamylputrescine oxidoreductase [Granulosicoccus antarcticus IMCC3135]
MSTVYKASRLPTHVGPAAWNAIITARKPTPVLSSDVHSDVVIVGAGFAGLSAARRLIQLNPDMKVTILEAGQIAEAASGRNSGFMIDLPHELASSDYAGSEKNKDLTLTGLNRKAIEFAAQAVEEYGIDPAYFDRAGKVNAAASEQSHQQNKSYAHHLEQMNEPYEMLDQVAMQEMTGSAYYQSGLYTPGTVMLQPAGYVRGLATGLMDKVRICENSPVIKFERQASDWCVSTPQGKVTANKVILANNGHLESFGLMRGRLMHVFLFACMTEEINPSLQRALGGHSRWGLTPSDPMGTTVRRIDSSQGGHRIITRTCADFCPQMETSEKMKDRALRVMRRKFDDRFPALSSVKMEFTWAGHLCLSRNSVSVAHELDEGVFAACCQNGLGTTRGVLTGIAAAESVCGVSSEISRYFAAEPEPERFLVPAPVATLGANAYLRWKEWQARRD